MSRIIAAIVGFVAVVALLSWGGWQWYKFDLDQQNQANHTSQQFQDATIQAERDRVQGYEIATDPGQKKQILLTYCAVYKQITHLELAPDLVQFTTVNC